ncbi:uncharacterized protein C7orf50 homolog [Triplophysa rosa]|uniref:WKF domain-containing protein n=1 Tax=Triplophysa rosa TaxID=992332 RepID=A0A9W7T9W3_TRIRA|nr:uncharacterized protein C7orf50 homolog [Triplophysa rosa]KAI7792262.1 hypothetical protein IRJ41_000605 [Triplophysa rosa]
MTKNQARGVQSNSTMKKKLKPSVDDEQNERTEKKVKTKKKTTDNEVCEVIVPEEDLLKLQNAKRRPKKQTGEESTEKTKMKRKRKAESSGDLEKTPLPQESDGQEDEDGEEDLSPEEKRVLERKLKKIRKKEENKKMKDEGKSTKQEEYTTNVAEKLALEYLSCWSERIDEWKFQKTRQTWLLQNMFDRVKVPDSYFEVLLAYLEGLRGSAKEKTLQKAEALVRWEGQGEGEGDGEDAESRRNRAKLVMQQL